MILIFPPVLPEAAVKNYHKLGGLNRNLFSHNSGSQKSEISFPWVNQCILPKEAGGGVCVGWSLFLCLSSNWQQVWPQLEVVSHQPSRPTLGTNHLQPPSFKDTCDCI